MALGVTQERPAITGIQLFRKELLEFAALTPLGYYFVAHESRDSTTSYQKDNNYTFRSESMTILNPVNPVNPVTPARLAVWHNRGKTSCFNRSRGVL